MMRLSHMVMAQRDSCESIKIVNSIFPSLSEALASPFCSEACRKQYFHHPFEYRQSETFDRDSHRPRVMPSPAEHANTYFGIVTINRFTPYSKRKSFKRRTRCSVPSFRGCKVTSSRLRRSLQLDDRLPAGVAFDR